MKKVLTALLRIILKLVEYPMYAISFLTPRDSKKWCFGGSENSKYMYLLTDFKSIGVRAIWFSKDRMTVKKYRSLGREAYTKFSVIGLFHLFTSKVYFITNGLGDVTIYAGGNAKIVNLWHGLPYKKIGLEDKLHKRPWIDYVLYYPFLNKPCDLFLSTSPFTEDIFRRSFRVKNNNFVEAMLPRNLILFKSKDEIITFLKETKESETLAIINKVQNFSKVYIYMPTFRDSANNFIEDAGFDFEKLDRVMQSENAVFILKLHPITDLGILSAAGNNYKNIIVLPNNIDVYPVLSFTSALITDYSSIYFDYILMEGKRVIFYTFDYEKYKTKDRDFNFGSEYMRGEYYYKFDDLLSALTDNNPEKISKEEIIKLFWNDNREITPLIKAVFDIAGK